MSNQSYLEHALSMSDEVWKRHANPWSGWTRMTIPVLFAAAIWSRGWISWFVVVPIGLLVAWTWWNPRAFPAPKKHDNWMTRGVLGERVWLNRRQRPIPPHHQAMGLLLACMSAFGIPPLVWGLWVYDIWAVIAGLILIIVGKLWFLDRMVWLLKETSTDSFDT